MKKYIWPFMLFKIKQRKRKLSKTYGFKRKRAKENSIQNLFKKTATWAVEESVALNECSK